MGLLSWSLIIALEILVTTGVTNSQLLQTNPFGTSWFVLGDTGSPYKNPNLKQTINNPIPSGHFGRNCEAMGILCSGHTIHSCSRYCQSIGYIHSTCEGPCCLCSNTEITDYKLQEPQNEFSSLGLGLNRDTIFNELHTDNKTKTNLPTTGILSDTANKARNPFTKDSVRDLEAQESSWISNPFYPHQNPYRRIPHQKQDNFRNSKTYFDKSHPSKQAKIQKSSNTNFDNSKSNNGDGSFQLEPNSVQVQPANGHKGVCQTEVCYKAAQELQSNMNSRADPCDNFYEYACGGFVKSSKIPQDHTEVTPFSILRDRVSIQLRTLFEEPIEPSEPKPFQLAKTLYRSCMNTDLLEKHGTQPLKDVLQILGGWPVLEGNQWQPQYFTWANFIVWFREIGYSHDYFMKISVEPDIKNVNKRLITIGEPNLGLTREVLIRGANEPAVNAYYKYMVETAVMMGASRSTAKSEMLKALNFEIQLAKAIYRPDNSRGATYYSPITIAELEVKYPSVPWLELFQRLLPKTVSINSQEILMNSAPQYLDAFLNLVASTDIRDISNYAIWRAVSSSVLYLNEASRRLQFNFAAAITGQQQRTPRWKECSNTVQANLGNAVGAMYIRRYFDQNSKVQGEEMIRDIQQAFLEILDEIDWMDEYTKSKAKEKALAIRVHVGYPAEHLSDAKITALYSEYDFKENEYFGNVRNLVISATNLSFKKLKSPVNKNDWVIHGKTAVVNAFYLPLENAIQFPAGILQHPFFDGLRPKYMNYGSIGWIAGHELSHGFDDQGHQFDKNGNLANWWDPFTKKTYTTKTQCIINQYGKYSPSGSGVKINGVNSQGENVADNGGIKQAYRGYQSWVKRNGAEKTLPGLENFTPNQIFWISAANNWCSVYRAETLRHQILSGVHSPGEFRVRGTFANNPDFAKDFSCSSGSRMNPIQKCSVW